MRWRIIRTLVHKEALRHLTNRGGIALAMLLLVMALLMSAYRNSRAIQAGAGIIRGVQRCYIDYWDENDPLVAFLKEDAERSLPGEIEFRNIPKAYPGVGTHLITFPSGVSAIQLWPPEKPGGAPKILCWYPGRDHEVMARYENWFWGQMRAYYRKKIEAELAQLPEADRMAMKLRELERNDTWVWRESHERFLEEIGAIKRKLPPAAAGRINVPEFVFDREPQKDSQPVGTRTTLAAALVLFALFFVCVYLLPSLTCEERERGVLLAQALSPASPFEIVVAKLAFYPAVSFVFAVILGALTTPAVLGRPMFWLAILVLAFGSLGIGMTIACIAKSQRSASMTALCYMLIVSMTVIICQQNQIAILPNFLLEFHGPRLLSAAMSNAVDTSHYQELGLAAALSGIWIAIATIAFRKYGWQ